VLSQIGISFNNDGTLKVNSEELQEALSSDFQAAAHVLLADALNQGGETVSIGPQLLSQLKSLTDPLEGPVPNAKESEQKTIERIQDQIDQMEERLEVRREILISQFTRADQALRQLTVLQSSLQGQINSLQAFS
jgi:flagellar hook-associated protein 2